jgi:hypothetical protein
MKLQEGCSPSKQRTFDIGEKGHTSDLRSSLEEGKQTQCGNKYMLEHENG